MYNRYIPQSDGTYKRNPTPSAVPKPSQKQSSPQGGRVESSKCPPAPHSPVPSPSCTTISGNSGPPPIPQGIGTFLRQLIPKNFDTSDLLIVILLLLMSGDCAEDQNTAILTLALYFFL